MTTARRRGNIRFYSALCNRCFRFCLAVSLLTAGAALLPVSPANGTSPSGGAVCGAHKTEPSHPAALSSLQRRLGVISLKGSRLPGLSGDKIDQIRISAFRDGALEAIPFQIDEYDDEGNLMLSGGKEARSDPKTDFDENDLVMFQARDLGPRASASALEHSGSRTWEVYVTDPVDDSSGWVYITCSPDPAPLSSMTYVRYTLEEGTVDNVDTSYYSIHYPWGAYYADEMVLYPSSSDGEGTDFLDRLKTRGTFAMFFSLLKVKVNEEKMSAKVVGYRDGPIRLVRRLNYWADLGLGIRSPKFEADIIYYDTFMNAPVTTHIPVSLDLFFSAASGEIGTDYNHKAYGMIFKNSNNPEGTLIDGRMSPQEKRLDLSADNWRLITGSQGSFFRGKIPENEMTPQIKMTLDYVDDISREDPHEREFGQVGHIFDRVDILNVKPGVYKTDVVFLIPPDYRPGDEDLYLEWEKKPLRVAVEPVGP